MTAIKSVGRPTSIFFNANLKTFQLFYIRMPRHTKTPSSILKKEPVHIEKVVQDRPSMLQIMKEGASFGMGSSLARVLIERSFPTQPLPLYETCKTERVVYESCLMNESAGYCTEQQTNLEGCLRNKA